MKSKIIILLLGLILLESIYLFCLKNNERLNVRDVKETYKKSLDISDISNFYKVYYKNDTILFNSVFHNSMIEDPVLAYLIASEYNRIKNNKASKRKLNEAKSQIEYMLEPYK